MDAFYASVEQRDNPRLKGLPIAVCYDDSRSVVTTASYEARSFGVHSALSERRFISIVRSFLIVSDPCRHWKAHQGNSF